MHKLSILLLFNVFQHFTSYLLILTLNFLKFKAIKITLKLTVKRVNFLLIVF